MPIWDNNSAQTWTEIGNNIYDITASSNVYTALKSIYDINTAGTQSLIWQASQALGGLSAPSFFNNSDYGQPVTAQSDGAVNASGFDTISGTVYVQVMAVYGKSTGTQTTITLYLLFPDGSTTQIGYGSTILYGAYGTAEIINNVGFSVSIAGKADWVKANVKIYAVTTITVFDGTNGMVQYTAIQANNLVAS